MSDYASFVEDLKVWMEQTANPDLADQREWCLFGLEDALNAAKIVEHFDKTAINNAYQNVYDSRDYFTPVAYWQLESDNLHALSKMMTYRHQPRLKNYRDDSENKEIRTFSALSWSLAKLRRLQRLT